ncbi:hypothetical protein BDY19DRAFT_616806 [Irpex rosettiformis]|uniref:Uncharacterized protein n=1 Tax=Irpex rosettiformis TaxID=378272 RepID=A0ACB8TP09_9APHY|nr:hypothetical protein BDY19DRAFT_616806 [Irpex rosettiformis]
MLMMYITNGGAHSALVHGMHPETKQGFRVGQILKYTPQNNSDMVPVEHPRVLRAHIDFIRVAVLRIDVYILLSNNLNISEYHGLVAIQVEGFHISNICEAVQHLSNCGCLGRRAGVLRCSVRIERTMRRCFVPIDASLPLHLNLQLRRSKARGGKEQILFPTTCVLEGRVIRIHRLPHKEGCRASTSNGLWQCSERTGAQLSR